jgi:glycosyltransferase involved in cell wall biosynthesis
MQTQVSVIMPVYNAEEYLREALQSVREQTHTAFELITVDDGSTDGSSRILREFASRDKRIITWRGANRGVAAVANECVKHARNDLIVRCDADDLMLPNRLERQIWFMENHPEISAACAYAWLTDRHGKVLARATPQIDVDRGIRELNPDHFVHLINSCAILRKRDLVAVGGYATAYRFGEDRELWGRLVASGYRLGVQPEFLSKVRIHRSSLTGSKTRNNELTCRYIDHNIVRELQGQKRISFATFLEQRKRLPILRRLFQNLSDISEIYYKEATRDYAEKQRWSCLGHSMLAIALNPMWAIRMLRKTVFRSRSAEPSRAARRQAKSLASEPEMKAKPFAAAQDHGTV